MSRRRYTRPGGHAFDPYRTSGIRLNEDLYQAEEDIDELQRRWRRILGAVILLLGLLALLALAYGLWIGLYNNQQDGRISGIGNNVTLLQNNVMQIILEMHGNVTLLQEGNFSWVIAMNAVNTAPDACVTQSEWLTPNQTALQSTYQLQNVQIGLLNFTLLVLNPPPTPLIYATQSDLISLLRICLINFVPAVNNLDQFAANGPHTMEFTSSNAARLSLTPDCVGGGTCTVAPLPTEGYAGTPAYGIQPNDYTSFVGPGESFIDWYYTYSSGAAPLGAAFTLLEPLRLVMFSS